MSNRELREILERCIAALTAETPGATVGYAGESVTEFDIKQKVADTLAEMDFSTGQTPGQADEAENFTVRVFNACLLARKRPAYERARVKVECLELSRGRAQGGNFCRMKYTMDVLSVQR